MPQGIGRPMTRVQVSGQVVVVVVVGEGPGMQMSGAAYQMRLMNGRP